MSWWATIAQGLILLASAAGAGFGALELRQATAELRQEREAAESSRQRQGERDRERDAAEMDRLKAIAARAASIAVLQDRLLKGIKGAPDGKGK